MANITMRVRVAYDMGHSEHEFSALTGEYANELALEFINSPDPIEVKPGKFYPRSRVVLYEIVP